jgi:hypothetical protein
VVIQRAFVKGLIPMGAQDWTNTGFLSPVYRLLAGDSGCENRPQAGSYPQAWLS